MRRLRNWWSRYSRVERKLWTRWVAATSLGLGLGSVLAEIVSSLVAGESEIGIFLSPRWQVPVAFSLGAPALAAQYLALRPYVPEARWWACITPFGAAFGAVVGPWVGYIAALLFLVVTGLVVAVIRQEFVLVALFYLGFVVAGGAAGAIIGSIMGILLQSAPQEWAQRWTLPLAGAWAAAGAIFWALAVPLMELSVRSGIMDSTATPTSLVVAGLVGVVAGAAAGAISGNHFVRTAITPAPEAAAPVVGEG